MRGRRSILALGIAAGALGGAPSAQAADPASDAVPVDVRLDGACGRAPFVASLRDAVRRPIDLDALSAPASLVVHFEALRGRIRGKASFVGSSGEDARTVTGRSCADVSAALALVAGTWLDAERTPVREVDVPVARPAAALPLVAPDRAHTDDVGEPDDVPGSSPELRSDLTVAALAFVGARAVSAAGAEVTGGIRRGAFGLRAGGRTIVGGRQDEADPKHTWVTTVISGCADVIDGGRIAAAGCARIDPGLVVRSTGAGRAIDPWLSVGAGPRLSSAVGRVRLELAVSAVLPVVGGSARDLAAPGTLPVAVEGGAAASYGFE